MFVFCLPALEAGSSGKRAFDRGTGARGCVGACFCTSAADTEDGTRIPEAALDDQGVFLMPWRKVGTTAGSAGCNAGKRSGGLGIGAGTRVGTEDEEPAACATRSKSCLEDCREEREAVECLALRTLPPAIPA